MVAQTKTQQKRIDREFMRIKRLAEKTDLIDFHRIQDDHYLVHFRCKGKIEDPRAGIETTSHHVVSVTVPPKGELYTRDSLTFVRPGNIFHPNIAPPAMTLPTLEAKTIDEFLQRIYDVITYRQYELDGPNCVNPEASEWARENMEHLPLDKRTLIPGQKGAPSRKGGRKRTPKKSSKGSTKKKN